MFSILGSARVEARVRHSCREAAGTNAGEAGGDDSADAPVMPDDDDQADAQVMLNDVDPLILVADAPITPDPDAPMTPDADASRPQMLMIR